MSVGFWDINVVNFKIFFRFICKICRSVIYETKIAYVKPIALTLFQNTLFLIRKRLFFFTYKMYTLRDTRNIHINCIFHLTCMSTYKYFTKITCIRSSKEINLSFFKKKLASEISFIHLYTYTT